MNEAAEIIDIMFNGFFTMLGAGIVLLLLVHQLHEIRNERSAVKVREENSDRRRQV